jgi:hypothetical protein
MVRGNVHSDEDRTHLMAISDWHQLYNRDFAHLITQHSHCLPCTIKVTNGHPHIISNKPVVCAGLGHMVPSMELFLSKNISDGREKLKGPSVVPEKCGRY